MIKYSRKIHKFICIDRKTLNEYTYSKFPSTFDHRLAKSVQKSIVAPGWNRTSYLSVKSQTRWPIAPQRHIFTISVFNVTNEISIKYFTYSV